MIVGDSRSSWTRSQQGSSEKNHSSAVDTHAGRVNLEKEKGILLLKIERRKDGLSENLNRLS